MFAISGCPNKGKGDGTVAEPTDKNPKNPPKAKVFAPEIADSLAKAQAGCTKVHAEADPDKIKTAAAYDGVASKKIFEDECKAPLDLAISKDASLATYKGDVNGKTYDVVALKKMADETPGRIELAIAAYEEIVKQKKEEEKKIWEPLLKNDRLKIYQEKGVPTSYSATPGVTDATPQSISQATTWIYETTPRDENGKQVYDKTTYKFKKDGKFDGKPKEEKAIPYTPPE
jgi:hypothetical protein